MSARCNLLPDPRFVELQGALEERLAQAAASVSPVNFGSLLDPLMRDVLERGFRDAGAHEGTVWLTDEAGEHLVPAYNTGPNAAQIVNQFRQPLDSGLVCMTLAMEQPFLENEVFKNSRQSKMLDRTLGVQTYALIAVPFYFLKACRGVVSCVQLKKPESQEPDPPGFKPQHLAAVQHAVQVLSRMLELRLLGATVNWTGAGD